MWGSTLPAGGRGLGADGAWELMSCELSQGGRIHSTLAQKGALSSLYLLGWVESQGEQQLGVPWAPAVSVQMLPALPAVPILDEQLLRLGRSSHRAAAERSSPLWPAGHFCAR